MEPIQCSETSVFNTRTPGKYPEDNLSLQHGKSLKSRKVFHISQHILCINGEILEILLKSKITPITIVIYCTQTDNVNLYNTTGLITVHKVAVITNVTPPLYISGLYCTFISLFVHGVNSKTFLSVLGHHQGNHSYTPLGITASLTFVSNPH